MKTWIQRSLLGAAGAAVALGALTACGHQRGWHERAAGAPEAQAQRQQWMLERVTRHLDLTPTQQEKLRTLAATLQAQRAAWVAQGDPRAQLRALVAGERFDRAQAQVLANQAAAALSARSPAVIAAFGDFFDSLDPAQQAQVRERMERRHRWWRRG